MPSIRTRTAYDRIGMANIEALAEQAAADAAIAQSAAETVQAAVDQALEDIGEIDVRTREARDFMAL